MLGTIYCSCTLHLSQLPSSQGKMKKQYELLSGKRDPWNMQSFHKSKLFSLNGSFCCGACVCAQPLQLCPTLWTLWTVGSSVRGILQARILEWVAMLFSRGSSQLRDQTLSSYNSCIAGATWEAWLSSNSVCSL